MSKETSIFVEICATCIACILHSRNKNSVRKYFADMLIKDLKILNDLHKVMGDKLTIQSIEHGIIHFKPFIESLGHQVEAERLKGYELEPFGDLKSSQRRYYIIFSGRNFEKGLQKKTTNLEQIFQIRDNILSVMRYISSAVTCLSTLNLLARSVKDSTLIMPSKLHPTLLKEDVTATPTPFTPKLRKGYTQATASTKRKRVSALISYLPQSSTSKRGGGDDIALLRDVLSRVEKRKRTTTPTAISAVAENRLSIFASKMIRPKNMVFVRKEKLNVLKVYEEARRQAVERGDYPEEIDDEVLKSTSEAVKRFRGYDTVKAKKIKAWIIAEKKRRESLLLPSGDRIDKRRVNKDFESEVWGELIITFAQVAHKYVGAPGVFLNDTIISNVTYSHSGVQAAAAKVRGRNRYISCRRIQSLKLSKKWIRGFLLRNNFSKKKLSVDKKNIPSDEEIQQIMSAHQKKAQNFSDETIWNIDETSFKWAIGPSAAYFPKDQAREQGTATDEKKCCTAILGVSATGRHAPPFFIVKQSSDNNDDNTTTVILENMLRSGDLGIGEGWKLQRWQYQVPDKFLRDGQEARTISVKYLLHTSGAIVTTQSRAWNDSTRMIMYADLILKSLNATYVERGGVLRGNYHNNFGLNNICLWLDNASMHCTELVEDFLKTIGIYAAHFPPNCTSFLQPLDIIFNKCVKSMIRRVRAEELVSDHDAFRLHLSSLDRVTEDDLVFRPSSPSVTRRINQLVAFIAEYNGDVLEQPDVPSTAVSRRWHQSSPL